MRTLPVNLDDELDLWLAKQKNQNETVREALRLYKGDITTGTRAGIMESYRIVAKKLTELEGKVDTLTRLYNGDISTDVTYTSEGSQV